MSKDKRSIEHRIPTEFPVETGLKNDENHLSIDVNYTEGGPNYFSGGMTPRGYMVNISAIEVKDNSVRFVIGGSNFGRRYLVLAAKRYNAKILAALDAAIATKLDEIIPLALARDYDAIRALLTTACAGIGQPKVKAAKLTTLAAVIAESNAKNGTDADAVPSPAAWDETAHIRASEA
jgi:hypothetical protein